MIKLKIEIIIIGLFTNNNNNTITKTETMSVLNWTELDLPIPTIILEYSEEIQKSILDYLKQLNNDERKAYTIAFNHLGTSFNIVRSTGYVSWKKRMIG